MCRFFPTLKNKLANSTLLTSLLAAGSLGTFVFFAVRYIRILNYNNYYRDGVAQGIEDAFEHQYTSLPKGIPSDKDPDFNTLAIFIGLISSFIPPLVRSILLADPTEDAINKILKYAGLTLSLFFACLGVGISTCGGYSSTKPSPYGEGYYQGYQSNCIPNVDTSCVGGVSDPYAGLVDDPKNWPLILTGTLTAMACLLMSASIYYKKTQDKSSVDNNEEAGYLLRPINTVGNAETRPMTSP